MYKKCGVTVEGSRNGEVTFIGTQLFDNLDILDLYLDGLEEITVKDLAGGLSFKPLEVYCEGSLFIK